MFYRNKKDGAVVEFFSEVKGGPWEPIEVSGPVKDPEEKPAAKNAQKSKTSKKAESKQ